MNGPCAAHITQDHIQLVIRNHHWKTKLFMIRQLLWPGFEITFYAHCSSPSWENTFCINTLFPSKCKKKCEVHKAISKTVSGIGRLSVDYTVVSSWNELKPMAPLKVKEETVNQPETCESATAAVVNVLKLQTPAQCTYSHRCYRGGGGIFQID